MTLYFRIFLIWMKSYFKGRLSFVKPIFTPFRVWPSDLDFFGHMTNSRYFNLMDAGRMDLLFSANLVKRLKERGWYAVVVQETIQFRRALKPLVGFQLKTEVTGYDEKHFLIRQTFLKGGKVVALGLVRIRFLGADKSRVSPREVLDLAGVDTLESDWTINPLEQEEYHYVQGLMNIENQAKDLGVS